MAESKKSLAEFEVNMKALAEVVQKMEQGQLSLSDSLAQFQQGLKLIKSCHGALNHAEKTIQQLTEQGEFVELPTDGNQG